MFKQISQRLNKLPLRKAILYLRIFEGIVILAGVAMSWTALSLFHSSGRWQYFALPFLVAFMAYFILTAINTWIRMQWILVAQGKRRV